MKEVLKTKYNKYDTYLFVIIISTIYGRWGLLHPTTIIPIVLLPSLISNRKVLEKYASKFFYFFVFWQVYSFFSLLWVKDMQNGYLDTFLLFVHFLLFLEIIVFSFKAKNPIRSIVYAWTIAFSLTAIVAVWEIFTNQHLASARVEKEYYGDLGGDFFIKEYATFTFYNPNTYCLFICLSFSFILYFYSQSRTRRKRYLSMFIAFLAIFIVAKDSSRGALISMAIMLATFIYYRLEFSRYKEKIAIFMAVLLVSFFLFLYGETLFGSIIFRIENKGLLESNARLLLLYTGWELFKSSNGLGSGVGSMMYELGHSSYNPTSYLVVHNMIMEILIEYGVLILFGLLLFFCQLYKNFKKMNDISRFCIVGALLAFPFYSVINSENLRPHFIWVFFASIYCFSIPLFNRNIR